MLFLVLDLLAVYGLNAISEKLEKEITVNQINDDIQFYKDNSALFDSTDQTCINVSLEIPSINKLVLQKKSTAEEVENSRIKIIGLSQEASYCFFKKSSDCLSALDEQCLKYNLVFFAEQLDNSGRLLKEKFNDDEKNYYRKVLRINQGKFNKEELFELAEEVLPVFNNARQRLELRLSNN